MVDIAHEVGSREFTRPLQQLGLTTRLCSLDSADFAFDGLGPRGPVRVGVERKTVSELVGAASRQRFVGRQLHRMVKQYDYRFLLVEGMVMADPRDGILLCGRTIRTKKGDWMTFWREAGFTNLNTYAIYKKRELTTLMKTSFHVLPTASKEETATMLHTLYRWWQKPWAEHKSCFALDTSITKAGEPDRLILDERTAEREVYAKWPHISWERSAKVSKYFRSIAEAAGATEEEWMLALGIKEGRTIAKALVRFLQGRDKSRIAKGA